MNCPIRSRLSDALIAIADYLEAETAIDWRYPLDTLAPDPAAAYPGNPKGSLAIVEVGDPATFQQPGLTLSVATLRVRIVAADANPYLVETVLLDWHETARALLDRTLANPLPGYGLAIALRPRTPARFNHRNEVVAEQGYGVAFYVGAFVADFELRV